MQTYKGSCHCGAVTYETTMSLEKVIDCNCSHCHKKGLVLVFVDKENFTLQEGKGVLTEYQFNKKNIRHLFCKICGVESFAEGVTFPKVAINIRCIEGIDLSMLTISHFNGKDL
jgi:hypothetical protein